MAYSSVTYSGNGATTTFAIPFGYTNQTDVTAMVSDVPTSFTWATSSTITFAAAPASATNNIVITRTTSRTPEVTYTDGSTRTAATDNKALLQCLYLAQEYLDGGLLDLTVTTGDITFGLEAGRPGASTLNNLYIATDTGKLYRDTGATWVWLSPAYTGDVTKPVGSTVTTIAANAVTTAKILNDAVTTAKILDANVTLAKLASLAAATVIGSVAGGVPAALSSAQLASIIADATTSLPGRIELATAAEVTTGTDAVRAVCPSTQQAHKSACKAWICFNGTGTPAIRSSYNVSSITDNGVGDYTINFTTALGDTNFAISGCATVNGNGEVIVAESGTGSSRTTSAVRILVVNSSNGVAVDVPYVSLMVMGN